MKKYLVVGQALEIGAGCIELTREQAEKRTHAPKPIKGDVYEIMSPIQFKVGEKIGFDGDLPKSLADSLMTPAELREKERADAEAAERMTGAAQAALESQLRAGLEKKLREEAAKDAAAGLALTLQERLHKRQAEFTAAQQAVTDEKDETKIDALMDAAKIAEGRLAELSDILAEATK